MPTVRCASEDCKFCEDLLCTAEDISIDEEGECETTEVELTRDH